MNERCKHDLLPGQCGFCPVPSGDPAERTCEELAAWLGRFAGTPMQAVAPATPRFRS